MAKTIKELSEQIELLENRLETIENQYRIMFDVVQALNDKVDVKSDDVDDIRKDLKDLIDCVYDEHEINNERFDTVDKTIKETQNNMVEIVGHIIREHTTLKKAVNKLIHQVETIRLICSI